MIPEPEPSPSISPEHHFLLEFWCIWITSIVIGDIDPLGPLARGIALSEEDITLLTDLFTTTVIDDIDLIPDHP